MLRPHHESKDDYAHMEIDGGWVEGTITGFPDVDHRGVIQGALNFTVPGFDEPITGKYIEIDERIANDTTKESFYLLQRMAKEEKPEKETLVTLDEMLEYLGKGTSTKQ